MNTNNESNLLNQNIIYDITPFTTTDYADQLSCIVWFSGCNMRCLYCYNEDIVLSKQGHYSLEQLFDFLESRRGLLEAVVLSGGEATQNQLLFICETIKALGYKIKLDTNGLNPLLTKKLVNKKLIDFIALDYKAPQYKFQEITQSNQYQKFEDTLYFLIQSNLDFEVRTTVHTELLCAEDINHIINHLHGLGYKKNYYIQEFLSTRSNLGNLLAPKQLLDRDKIREGKLKVFYRD